MNLGGIGRRHLIAVVVDVLVARQQRHNRIRQLTFRISGDELVGCRVDGQHRDGCGRLGGRVLAVGNLEGDRVFARRRVVDGRGVGDDRPGQVAVLGILRLGRVHRGIIGIADPDDHVLGRDGRSDVHPDGRLDMTPHADECDVALDGPRGSVVSACCAIAFELPMRAVAHIDARLGGLFHLDNGAVGVCGIILGQQRHHLIGQRTRSIGRGELVRNPISLARVGCERMDREVVFVIHSDGELTAVGDGARILVGPDRVLVGAVSVVVEHVAGRGCQLDEPPVALCQRGERQLAVLVGLGDHGRVDVGAIAFDLQLELRADDGDAWIVLVDNLERHLAAVRLRSRSAVDDGVLAGVVAAANPVAVLVLGVPASKVHHVLRSDDFGIVSLELQEIRRDVSSGRTLGAEQFLVCADFVIRLGSQEVVEHDAVVVVGVAKVAKVRDKSLRVGRLIGVNTPLQIFGEDACFELVVSFAVVLREHEDAHAVAVGSNTIDKQTICAAALRV